MASAVRALTPAGIVSDMTTGNPELRRQIALRYMISGVRLPADELVITNGAMEALNLCLQCVTEPGDRRHRSPGVLCLPSSAGASEAESRRNPRASA